MGSSDVSIYGKTGKFRWFQLKVRNIKATRNIIVRLILLLVDWYSLPWRESWDQAIGPDCTTLSKDNVSLYTGWLAGRLCPPLPFPSSLSPTPMGLGSLFLSDIMKPIYSPVPNIPINSILHITVQWNRTSSAAFKGFLQSVNPLMANIKKMYRRLKRNTIGFIQTTNCMLTKTRGHMQPGPLWTHTLPIREK